MTTAGELRERIELSSLTLVPDGGGGEQEEWTVVVTCPARIKVLTGGETVMQGRLVSQQTLVCTVRNQPALATAETTWRLRNVRTDKEYNIRSITPDARHAWVDILCETDTL